MTTTATHESLQNTKAAIQISLAPWDSLAEQMLDAVDVQALLAATTSTGNGRTEEKGLSHPCVKKSIFPFKVQMIGR